MTDQAREMAETEATSLHAEKGTTIFVYFPPEAPPEVVDQAMDDVANLVYGLESDGPPPWDPSVYSRAGDYSGA